MISGIQNLLPVDQAKISNLKSTSSDANGVQVNPVIKPIISGSNQKADLKDSSSSTKDVKKNLSASATPNYDTLTKNLQSVLNNSKLNVEIKFDKETNKMIVQLIDPKTKEVVEQFPPEIVVKLSKLFSKSLESGSMTNAKV